MYLPRRVYWRICFITDFAPYSRTRDRSVSSECKANPGRSDRTALTDEELCNDVQAEHGQASFWTKHLQAQCREWLAKRAGNN